MCNSSVNASRSSRGLSAEKSGGSAPAAGSAGGSALTSLERLETIEQGLSISVQSSAAHSRHRIERLRIMSALADDATGTWSKRVAKMADCCSTPGVGLTPAGAVGCVWFRCRDRLCPLCANARSRQVTDRVITATRNADSLRFLTLTLVSSDRPLREQLDDLYRYYREFRRTKAWRSHVFGGIATVEVTRNAETGRFHPHLHVLIDGTFWRQGEIADAWEAVTGTSRVCDIRAVRSRSKFAAYIAKYASKPAAIGDWPPDAILEYAEAIHRRRMVLATGNMHASKVEGDDEPERERITGDRIPLHALERRTNLGCTRSAVVLASLASQSAAYQSSLAVRTPGTSPTLTHGQSGKLHDHRRAFAELLALWSDDPVCFVNGGSGAWVEPPKPKRPKGTGRLRDSTAPLADWHRRDTRHV